VGKDFQPVIGYIICHWKIVPIVLASLFLAAVAIIADTSPVVPWLLGLLTTVFMALLAVAWKIQARLSILETQVSPLWSALQKEVADTLHHPHPESAELDGLLEDLEALRLDAVKTARLNTLLREKVDDKTQSEDERKRAELLLFIMSRVIKEREEKLGRGAAKTITRDAHPA
jgi:hypothetical protein